MGGYLALGLSGFGVSRACVFMAWGCLGLKLPVLKLLWCVVGLGLFRFGVAWLERLSGSWVFVVYASRVSWLGVLGLGLDGLG